MWVFYCKALSDPAPRAQIRAVDMSSLALRICHRTALSKPCRVYEIDGKPYLERYFLFEALGIRFYLHRFVDGDHSESFHHHPWPWSLALILCGGYREERLRNAISQGVTISPRAMQIRVRNLRLGRFNWIGSKTLHRIEAPLPGTWTLFIHAARKTQRWGQLVPVEDGRLAIEQVGTLGKSDWEHDVPLGADHPDRQPFSIDYAK